MKNRTNVKDATGRQNVFKGYNNNTRAKVENGKVKVTGDNGTAFGIQGQKAEVKNGRLYLTAPPVEKVEENYEKAEKKRQMVKNLQNKLQNPQKYKPTVKVKPTYTNADKLLRKR